MLKYLFKTIFVINLFCFFYINEALSEIVKEISTSAGSPGYNTPYAFRKKGSKAPEGQYLKMGYKPVNQKALRKKSKGFDYVDLYKD